MAKRSNILGVIAVIAASLLLLGLFGVSAKAAAPDFNQVSTAAATSTLSYMGVGTATTTLVYDSMYTGSDSAVLLTQLTASSSSTVLNTTVEYAQNNTIDCVATPTACDWYADNLLESYNSTTSPVKAIQVANSYSWTAVSSTRASKAIVIPTPTRYTRVTYSLTGAAGGVWGSIVAKKQQPE